MTPLGVLYLSVALMTTMQGTLGDGHIFCSFYDDMWQAARREAPTPPPLTGIFSADNMANKIKTKSGVTDPGSYGEVLKDNKTIQCRNTRDFCYTLWEGDHTDKKKITIIKQGCWDQSDRESCSQSGCVARSPLNKMSNNTHFCCCTGDMCNVNVTSEYVPDDEATPNLAATPKYVIMPDPNYRYRTIIIALVSVFGVALVIALSYLVYRLTLGSQKHPYEPEHLVESPPTPMFDLEQLKLCSLISGGRYGDVWRGTLYDHEVAVKLFAPVQKQYFINERDVYTLPHMEHPCLLKFYGSDENMNVDGIVPYSIIVMGFVPRGTLCQYLKETIIDWNQMCRLALSAASGLAHLHTDILVGDKEKPAIAHRDFNSRNILIKDDLTCCICDFGFAMKILGSKFIRNGFEEIAEQSPISDVGTLRYMAPEVLDGAVNLRDCEASLKQIDVYALGLVMWEIASRCSELYQGMPVPDYKLPFEADLGVHPSFEEMQRHVSWKRGRPSFPDVWKDTNQAIRALKETIEDSWDQDAEARLTSLCVEERVLEMMTLWETRNKVGVTPTNPVTLISGMPDQILRNQTSDSTTGDGQTGDQIDRNANMPNGNLSHVVNINDLSLPPGVTVQRSSRPENSVSTSTVETTLTASPSDPLPVPLIEPPGKTNNLYARTKQPLQPHQGQNPTVERNTHKRSDDKLVVLGNTLVDQSIADEAQAHAQSDRAAPSGGANTNANFTDDLFDAIADNLETSLVQNDLLSQQQYPAPSQPQPSGHMLSNRPIPHQNNPTEPLIARPKQPNVPGNGSAYHHQPPLPQRAFTQPEPSHPPKQKNKFRFKKPKTDKISGKMSGLVNFGKNLLKGGNHDSSSDDGSNYFPTENLRNPAQMTSGQAKPSSAATNCQDGANPGKSNLEPRQVPTEVCLLNGAPVVRPMSLPVGAGKDSARNYNLGRRHHSDSSSDDSASDQETLPKYREDLGPPGRDINRYSPPREPAPESQLGFAEVGVAKLQTEGSLVNARPALKKVKLKSQSSVDLSPTATSFADSSDEESRVRRPSSLSVNGHNYKKVPQSVPCLNNLGREEAASNRQSGGNQQPHPRAHNGIVARPGSGAESHRPLLNGQRHSPDRDTNGRYSLCDDRLLSHSTGDVNLAKRGDRQNGGGRGALGQSSISLTQFGSVERDVNRLHKPADYPC